MFLIPGYQSFDRKTAYQNFGIACHLDLQWWTHKIDRISGLHKNDFIMAAKSDEIFSP